MQYPTLYEESTSRSMTDTYYGYNHNLRINEGEFYDMENLTSDHYPVLAPRSPRGLYAEPTAPAGLIAKDSLCYIDGTDFVIDKYHVNMGLSTATEDNPKSLISMGAYVIIMPDKKYINTMNLTEYGDIDASFTTTTDVTFSLCTVDGAAYTGTVVGSTAPSDPENMALWIDTSSTPHTLKQYSATSGMWVQIATTYVKIEAAGIGAAFGQYDGVAISGIQGTQLADLNSTMVIWARGNDYIVVIGIIDTVTTQAHSEGAITVKREMPQMDYITESENRLWGCRYGLANNGQIVNEIYACKLGDFKNWNCFMGISTDSYAASCGTDGQFTGAITHLGYPLFFKENCLHKVYGNYPSNFQIQSTACRGVEKGSENSLAIVNSTLYYKGRNGICAYDGSLPSEISTAFGNETYSEAVGTDYNNKYYVSMKDSGGTWQLFVYDAAKGLWHREDSIHLSDMCACRGVLYGINADTNNIITLAGGGGSLEDAVEWMAETGELGLSSPDMKYISRITLRLSLAVGATLSIYARYDLEDTWTKLCDLTGTSLRSFSIPVRPRRSDHLKLKLVGRGECRLYSWTKTVEEGSELS